MRPYLMTIMRRLFWSFILLSATLLTYSVILSTYYYNDFTANTDGWALNYPYGRVGISGNTSDMTISRAGNAIQIRNNVNADNVEYIGSWVGRMAFYSNTSYNSSPTNPFGVEFRRTYARIDPHDNSYGNDNPESHRHIAAQSFWLISDPYNLQAGAAEYSTFENYILMYDMMRMNFNLSGAGTQPRSTWGYYISSEQRFDLTQAIGPDGTTNNIINDGTYTLEWNYDEQWGVGENESAGADDTDNATPANNNPVIIRLTHDGTNVRFYINPNPDDTGGNPYPNEFLLLGSATVGWNQSIKFMTGMESKRHDCEMQAADIDSVLIRSVASSINTEITPYEIAAGSTNSFQVVITPTFTANDAGIGEFIIKKPSSYSGFSWNTNNIQVFTENGSGTNHGTISTLSLMTRIDSVPTADNQVFVKVSGDEVKFRFRQTSDANNGVINNSSTEKRIIVNFTLPSPTTPNSSGDTFTVYADCVKYNAQNYSRWSTTGKMKSVVGDAYTGDPFSGNTMAVKTFINPDALATVAPEILYVGNNRTVYYYIATTNENSPAISELRIRVPDDYQVNTSDSTRFSSLYIANDNANVFATNISGTNFIYVLYSAEGGGLPSPGGLDRITIQVDSTPTNFSGAQTNTIWTAEVFSSISGTSSTSCRTNLTYPNNLVVVRQLPPDVQGSIATAVIENGTNFQYNNIKANSITYTINNNGGAGNTIKKAGLMLPSIITNISGVSSSIIANPANIKYYSASNFLLFDYKSDSKTIANGGVDTITLFIYDNITPMSGYTNSLITLIAENENGDGWVSGTEGSSSWDIYWKNPPAAGQANLQINNSFSQNFTNHIYTSDYTTQMTIQLNNTGGSYNDIKMIEITVPSSFTNISAINSIKMLDDAANSKITNNKIYLYYVNDANGVLGNTQTDSITFTVVDNVSLSASNDVVFTVKVANTTNTNDLYDTSNLGAGNKAAHFVYPPAFVTGYVSPTLIDSSTITNTLVYTISNSGSLENTLGEVRIYIPDSIASNLIDASSTKIAAIYVNEELADGSTNYIRVRYSAAGSPLAGGDVDQITFKMVDHITSETNFAVTASATNVKQVWTPVSVTSGQTNVISIQIPPASAKVKIQPNVLFTSPSGTVTNTLVYTLTNTGTGSNDLTNAIISFPAFLQNKILSVTNELDTEITVDNIGKKIIIWYTNTVLAASTKDGIYIRFENDFTSYQTNESFTCTVDNGTGAVSATEISGASFNVSVVKRPEIEISQADATPNEVFTTDTVSTFTYKIQNGETGGKGIKKVRILIPSPFVTNFVPNSPWPGSTESLISTNGKTYLEIDYSANDLDAGNQDEIIITVDDIWTAGITNVDWTALVDYGDGYGWRNAEEKSGKSINISFIFPDASAQAQISPRSINKNESSSQMTLNITNTGVLGNHIYLVEVKLPVFITNITSITSSIIANNVVLTNSNTMVLEYYNNSTNIPAPGVDTITFTIHDNVTVITNDILQIKVANSSNTNQYKSATELFSDALKLSYFKPDAVAYAYINPKYPISLAKPNSIYSTVTTSTLEFNVVNNGASGNNLDVVRIYIPESHYYTNTVANITSAVVPGSQIHVNSNIITVYYTNTNYTLFPTQTDTITFSINDKITTNNSFAVWNSFSRFVTSGDQYLTNLISSGQTNVVFFEMPSPVVKAEFSPRSLYTTTTNVTLNFNVTNTGSGSNNINKLYITVPVNFRSGLLASSISNSFAASILYNAGTFTMTYTNFSIGSNDSFSLVLSNAYTSVNSVDFSVSADNGIVTNAVSPLSSGYLTMDIVTPPSSYVEIPSPKDSVYNRLYSTDYENNYEIIIKNDGTGSADILKSIITLPAGFTISSSGSSKIGGAFIVNTNNTVILDYQAGGSPIAVSQSDTVTITSADPFHFGDTNVSFNVKVDDGNGYADTRLSAGKTWQVNYVHPSVQSEHYIDGFAVDTKPSVFVAPSSGTANTNFTVKVINTGSLSNVIHKSRIIVAEVFTIQNTPTSSFGGTVSVNSNIIEITYGSTKLPAGGTDTIDFDVSYTLSAATNNMLIAAEVDNNNGTGYAASTLSSGKFNNVDIIYPPLSVLAGVKNMTSLYIINTNDSIQYQIKNRSQGYEVFKSVITNFDMTYFSSINVTSQKLATITVSTANSTITLEYSGANRILFNESDILTINVQYSVTNLINTNLKMNNISYLTNPVLTTQTNVTGLPLESIDTDLANSDNQNLGLRPAPYGRITGIVLPTFKTDTSDPDKTLPNIIKVEIVDSANNLITTPYQKEIDGNGNLVGKSLLTYSDSAGGTYSINYIPANTSTLRFTAEGFKVTLTNFTIVSNQVLNFPTQTLKNALLTATSANKQIVMDYNDTNTRFIVPIGGILDQFSLDIGVIDMNQTQESDVLVNTYVKKINDSSMLGCFKFTLKDQNGDEVVGEGLSKDAIIQLHYTTTGLNLPIGTGWEEDNLAVFYWKETTGKWIPVGGTVDKNKQIISAKISYLHNYYSVMSVNPEATTKAIYNVIASPNPFTPGRGGDNSSKVKITFSLKDSQEKYTVSIFTLKGKRVRFFERDGTYRQGEVFWDGKDGNGFNIGGGVYLYQIKAGDKVFTGSILLLK